MTTSSVVSGHFPSAPTVIPRRRSVRLGRRLLAVLAGMALVVGVAAGTTTSAGANGVAFFCSDGTQPYAPVADVEAFDTGHPVTGLSVTHGTSPEGFTGSYVGFIDDGLGKEKDLLLFRLTSPVIDGTEATGGLKGAGIWAGMSGSPVYDQDGRLIGAVAYKLTTENLPIAGVTPAEYMKSIGTTGVISPAAKVRTSRTNLKLSAASAATAGTTLTGSTFTQIRTVNVAGTAGTKQNAFANRTLARTPRTAPLASFLHSNSFVPAPGVAPASVTAPLVAGGSIAAMYTSGDQVLGAVGSITAICGDTVWAFGHPMDSQGRSSMLMANASTALIVPDSAGLTGSAKVISQFGGPVGMITEDRGVGIRGTQGVVSSFGIDVDVRNAAGTHIADYQVAVADQAVTAAAVAGITGQAAYEQLDQFGKGTGEVAWAIDYEREDGSAGTLANSQVVDDPSAFPDSIGTPPAEAVWAITSNEFEEVAITHVAITLTLKSPEALNYKVGGIQVLSKGSWVSLAGRKLKAGSSYSIRPLYRVKLNGKAHGSVAGSTAKLTLRSSARKSGSFSVSAANRPMNACSTDEDGNIVCDDFAAETDAIFESFDELVAVLADAQPDSLVLGDVTYRLKKGTGNRSFTWIGPGVMQGTAKGTFKIKA